MKTWGKIKEAAQSAWGWVRGREEPDSAIPGEVSISQRNGVRYLTLGTEWIQGAMLVARPDEIELEYARRMMGWMLFESNPSLIVQMGLGGGALAKFCLRHFPRAELEVIEIDASVARACHDWFSLPRPSAQFRLVIGDALAYALDPSAHGRADVLQVDVYDAYADGPAVGSASFYQGCFDCLAPGGWMCVNLFGDHPGFTGQYGDIKRIFGRALTLGRLGSGNVVVMARKGSIDFDMVSIEESARTIERAMGMAVGSWVDDLRSQNRS